MGATLIVSLSGLTPDDPRLPAAAALAAELDGRGVRITALLRPSGPGGPVAPGSPLAGWLHERRAGGDAVAVHGFDHTADPCAAGQLAGLPRIGRRAEFAALPRHEAGLRLTAARRVLTALGLRTDVFVPPRWSASPGTVQALVEQGFAVLADETGVRHLHGGPALRGRVLGLRTRTGESRGHRLLAAEVTRTARRGGAVRLDVRAADLDRPTGRDTVLAAVDAALAVGAVPTTYRISVPARAAA
ncbi:MAG TPA: DUF2334 domain-containing protein [Pseudonocardia sp.]|nr:DUF2334 domain-containing protein [Pseudonocardia sp.]